MIVPNIFEDNEASVSATALFLLTVSGTLSSLAPTVVVILANLRQRRPSSAPNRLKMMDFRLKVVDYILTFPSSGVTTNAAAPVV